MQVMSNGRARRTESEWREILTRWEESGLPSAEFCRRERLNLTSFRRWQARTSAPRQRDVVTVTPKSTPTSIPLAAPDWTVEVTLPNGVQLEPLSSLHTKS